MARPNKGRESYPRIRIHPVLLELLMARREALANDGMRDIAKNASMVDISKEFVEHYWNMASFSVGGAKMREALKHVHQRPRNI